MKHVFSSTFSQSPTAVVFIPEKTKQVSLSDTKLQDLVNNALSNGTHNGKKGDAQSLLLLNSSYHKVVLFGIGKIDECKAIDIEKLGGKLYTAICDEKVSDIDIIIPTINHNDISVACFASALAHGIELRSYRFDKYITKQDKPIVLKCLHYITTEYKKAEAMYADLSTISKGIFLSRDLVTEPGNVLYPETMADRCRELQDIGLEVEVLDRDEMQELGMGALLGVAQGSVMAPKLIILKWYGLEDKDVQPVSFIGKGVTFDSGGLSLKPANSMMGMKYDMGGAGVVIGLLKTLALRKAKANVIGVIGAVENMPDAGAQRPNDVVTTMSGQTVEVLNTDAEGRLVLADALWYCQDRFKPKFMINLATLTGAMMVALGRTYAGFFTNSDELANRLSDCGKKTDELVWRLPLHEEYDDMIKSDIADMQNIGGNGEAGSITAAQFLQRFVNKTPWCHIDIAGVNWKKNDTDLAPKGATGQCVRLLNQLVKEYYEIG